MGFLSSSRPWLRLAISKGIHILSPMSLLPWLTEELQQGILQLHFQVNNSRLLVTLERVEKSNACISSGGYFTANKPASSTPFVQDHIWANPRLQNHQDLVQAPRCDNIGNASLRILFHCYAVGHHSGTIA